MRLKSSFLFVSLVVLFGFALPSGSPQAAENDEAPWRTSFEAFAKAIDELPAADIPACKVEEGEDTGAPVSRDAAIMKRFGGTVEFSGIFQGVVTIESPPQHKRQKIDIEMAWPPMQKSNRYGRLHLYPKRNSLKAWKALKPNTAIKFRAVVAGISRYEPWIPTVSAISILLEDGEIVGQ
jgi:hypothetical protein